MNENNSAVIGRLSNADPMAQAEEIPQVGILQQELRYAWDVDGDSYGRTAWKEDVRFCRWRGQTSDGLKHRERQGAKAMPYDQAPDSRCFLADGVINSLVDVLYQAFFGARVKTAPTSAKALTVAQAAEWRAIISWMLHGPLRTSLIDDVEFAAQLTNTIGWCVLHPNWRKEKLMRNQTLTMEQILQMAQAAQQQPGQPGPDAELAQAMAQAPVLIMDESLEAEAIHLFQQFFPDLDAKTARRVVRDLRGDGASQFPMETDGPNEPVLRVLVPGQHFIMPPESTALPGEERWMAVRVFLSEQGVRTRAQEEQWNEDFLARIVKTKGLSIDPAAEETVVDQNLRDIEFFYVYQRRNSENGVPGIYCTVISMFVNPDGGKGVQEADYGFNRLADYAHKQYPFVFQQTEIIGLRPMDARGVPEIVATKQNQQKNSNDLLYVYEQMSVVPPLQKTGVQASKLPPGLTPMGIVNNTTGGEWKWFSVPPGNPEISLQNIARVQKEVEDQFGIPREDSPPARSQARLGRNINRWLAKWGEALWQLSVLAYQNLSPEELQAIIGRAPLLTADLVAKQQLMLWFEVRSMDSDWLDDMIKNTIQLLAVDTGGTIDRSKLVSFVMAYMDPTLAEEVTMDQAGAKQAMFKEVRDEVDSIMAGNKPMLRQNDPTAQMKLMFVQQIVTDNPKYKLQLTDKFPNGQMNPEFRPDLAENMQTYVKNLQHNQQEMVTSKMQGRLGVADTGNAPVASGAA